MTPIRVAIVEDQSQTRLGLSALIDGTPGFRCSGAWRSCEEMLSRLPAAQPDILLLDLGLPGMSGIDGTRRARAILPDLPVLILTVHEDNESVLDALCAGACGYLVKKTPPARLLEAIREAHEGGSPMSSQVARRLVEVLRALRVETSPEPGEREGDVLTLRERQILRALAEGSTYQAAAQELHISPDTVRFHIRKIYRKLHAHTQSEAVAKAMRLRLL
ncbi:MAG TPA: response regulator transcription factor [Thermoanaerobaculia bacterium]